MEKCTWKATLLPGKKAEYIRRHDALWPEMAETLRQAGIRNYTIWCCGDELFGYYECERGAAYAARVQAESPVVARWNEYMRDVMRMARSEAAVMSWWTSEPASTSSPLSMRSRK